MGASFYSVLEYEKWNSYQTVAEFYFLTDNEFFEAIAFGDGGITDGLPYPPRGLPSDLSARSIELFFVPEEEARTFLANFESDEESISLERYAKDCGAWAIEKYRKSKFLPMPESCSHGWLNLEKLSEALSQHGLVQATMSSHLKALLAAMHALSDESGPDKVRLVFAFGM